ncbi:MAG: alpha/beta hydrolase [Rhodospirillales bacterium]|nr:alpha/beta hydrolase [Rhodospirillales bacterium]
MDVIINPENEKLYNARAAIPDNQQIFERWTAASHAARASHPNHAGIKYGAREREVLDIYPNENPDAPVMMFIHGGYWQARCPADFNFIAPELVKLGFCVVLAGYDLCPDVPLDKITSQMQAAARYVWHTIATYGGDKNRFYVSGHSAGGHLTAELMATDWTAIDSEIPNDFVKGGVPISGVFDLEPLIPTSINEKVGLDTTSARRNSPLLRNPVCSGPLVLAVGGDESAAFFEQADRLAAKWGPHLSQCTRLDLPGAHHMAAVDELAKPGSALLGAIAGLI